MLSWLAALNHMHYLRRGLVFLNDMKCSFDSIKEVLDQGNFTVKQNSRVFSSLGIDQTNEQNHMAVKVDSGAIGIMDKESESALLERALSGPYVAKMVCESLPQTIFKIQNHSERSFNRAELD